jgi:hypothetical protein
MVYSVQCVGTRDRSLDAPPAMVVELGPAANLRFVVTGGLLLALAFIGNGVYVLVAGFQPLGPGLRRLASARPMGLLTRLWAGLVPLSIGLSILALLMSFAAHRHAPPLSLGEWLKTRSDSFLNIILLGGGGVWFLIRPDTMVKWVNESRQTAPKEGEERGVRVLSALLLGMAIFLLVMILAAPSNVP